MRAREINCFTGVIGKIAGVRSANAERSGSLRLNAVKETEATRSDDEKYKKL